MVSDITPEQDPSAATTAPNSQHVPAATYVPGQGEPLRGERGGSVPLSERDIRIGTIASTALSLIADDGLQGSLTEEGGRPATELVRYVDAVYSLAEAKQEGNGLRGLAKETALKAAGRGVTEAEAGLREKLPKGIMAPFKLGEIADAVTQAMGSDFKVQGKELSR